MMNLTLTNYEEYFLLLADNELSPAEEALVKQFAAQHSHLQEELQLLLSCRLDAADMPVFPKEMLLRPSLWNVENPEPVHTQMLNLLDDELPATQKEELKEQIAASPALQAEWNTLKKAVLPAEAIIYPDKSGLYKQHKIRPLVWVRWAAAAAVFFLTWLLWPAENNNLLTTTVAALPNTKQNITVSAQTSTPNINDTNAADINVTKKNNDGTTPVEVAIVRQPLKEITETKTQRTMASASPVTTTIKDSKKVIFNEEVVVSQPEELAAIEPDNITLGNSNPLSATLSKKENVPVQTAQFASKATILSPDALQHTIALNNNEPDERDEYVQIAGARFDKHKVRGLFRGITRSVTRTFSKSKMQPAETAYTTRNL